LSANYGEQARAIPVRTSSEENLLVASEALDSNKIRWAIEGFGSFKSAGEDGIFPALLKNRIEILSGPLIKIFTTCLALRYIPDAWQRVRVIFIPEPGCTLYELAKSFLPIILTSFLVKTMERLVDQSIRMGSFKIFPLERSQHAYQRVYDLVSTIKSALGHKIFALGAFLDVERAFDNTSFESMSKAYALIMRCISQL
jgi:hypothetical protein